MSMKLTLDLYVVTHETKHGIDVYLCRSHSEMEQLRTETVDDTRDDEYWHWDMQTVEYEVTDA